MQVNLRAVVLDILLEVMTQEKMSHVVINNALTKYQYLDKNQRNFISRVALGTIEKKLELDYIINLFSKTKTDKQKPVIRAIMEMAVYQLKYMDSVPDSAVCNEAVKLAAKRGFSSLKPFVNGVLRNIARSLDNIEYPTKETDFKKYLEVKYSCPQWLIKYWSDMYGEETTECILKGFLGNKKTYIRVNTNVTTPEKLQAKLESEGVNVSKLQGHKELDYALEISGYDYLWDLESFVQGEFYIQDVSSMLAAEGNIIKDDAYVIDVCAAPGGKSMNAALKAVKGKVSSRDVSELKVDMIEANLERLDIDNVVCKVWDATILDEEAIGKADVVIADLPCSGLGIIGRKPDIKYNMTLDKLDSLQTLQRSILKNVWQYLKPGGILIYSTCTINKCENEDNVLWITKEFPLELVDETIQLMPDEKQSDGFFIARLRRK